MNILLNKIFFVLAERYIWTLRMLLQKIYSTGERDLKTALAAAVQSYNSSVHSVTKFTPNQAAREENQDSVLLNIEKRQHQILADHYREYDRINSQFKVGDVVRTRLPRDPFRKESENLFSNELYRIATIVPSDPTRGYKLEDMISNAIIPGSWLLHQLLKQ